MKSLYEELGGTYRQVGDYFLPDIELPERSYEIGKYVNFGSRATLARTFSHTLSGK